MRMHAIPLKIGTITNLLNINCIKVDNKKQNPANNHRFRDSLKFFIKSSPHHNLLHKITDVHESSEFLFYFLGY